MDEEKMSKVEKQKKLEYASKIISSTIDKYQAYADQLWVNDQKQAHQRIEILIEQTEKALFLIDLVIESYEWCNSLPNQEDCNTGLSRGCQWDDITQCSWNENPQQSIPGWDVIKDDLSGDFIWTGGKEGSGDDDENKFQCPYADCHPPKFETDQELRDHIEEVHEYRELPSISMADRGKMLAIATQKWPAVGQKVEVWWEPDNSWLPAVPLFWNEGGITVEWLNKETSDIATDQIFKTVRLRR